ncbi:MAG: hypothetical protein VXY77_02725 [Pseudomonadota bacterium]|nr:hypothetical protein [Pseudomonadota bacterium]
MATTASRQLVLPFLLEHKESLDDFFAFTEAQKQLITLIKQASLLSKPLCIVGGTGSGKTQILRCLCYEYMPSIYLNGSTIGQYNPSILTSLGNTRVCIDNAQYFIGNQIWEQAIFSYLTQSPELPPLTLALPDRHAINEIKLADLRSRVHTFMLAKLHPLSCDQQKQAILKTAKDNGLALNKHLVSWMQKRYPRDNHFFFKVFRSLFKYCMEYQQKASLSSLKVVLNKIDDLPN